MRNVIRNSNNLSRVHINVGRVIGLFDLGVNFPSKRQLSIRLHYVDLPALWVFLGARDAIDNISAIFLGDRAVRSFNPKLESL